jgi:hypothetical protein
LDQQVGSQPLVEVDDHDHVAFGGTAPYVGWVHASIPHHITGPDGSPTALQFVGAQWLQLGESGFDAEGNWTLDCYVQVSAQALQHHGGNGVLLGSADGIVHVGATDLVHLLPSLSDGWHRLTVEVEQLPQRERRTILVDGVAAASARETPSLCDVVSSCSVQFFTVGRLSDGSGPFPLPIHDLRLYSRVVTPADVYRPAQLVRFAPLRFYEENSRWVEFSCGADTMDTWNTFGWDAAAHEQVRVTLEPTGALQLKGMNASLMWDRAVASIAL